MKNMFKFGAALALGVSLLGTAAYSFPTEYLRKGDQLIVLFEHEGKLYCRRMSDEFELCHGMEKQADGSYAGPNMKHPDMPKFMTFKGTVVLNAGGLSIEGCVLGGVCDAEKWTLK